MGLLSANPHIVSSQPLRACFILTGYKKQACSASSGGENLCCQYNQDCWCATHLCIFQLKDLSWGLYGKSLMEHLKASFYIFIMYIYIFFLIYFYTFIFVSGKWWIFLKIDMCTHVYACILHVYI